MASDSPSRRIPFLLNWGDEGECLGRCQSRDWPGEFVAVMGQSGSGKTTMMNIIGLLDRPSGGRYVFADHDVSQLSENARARLRGRALGFIFQSYNLLPALRPLSRWNSRSYIRAFETGDGAPPKRWNVLASWTASSISQLSFRTESSNGSQSRVRSFPTLWCCSLTNPQGRWTQPQGTS